MRDSQQLIAAIWSISEGRGSGDELELLRADERASLSVLDRLILETEEDLAVVRNLPGDERDQVVADFTDTLDGLRATAARLRPPPPAPAAAVIDDTESTAFEYEEAGEVQLQASWSAGQVVVWAGGRGAVPEGNEGLATRLEAIGGPAVGWQLHPGVDLPGGVRAEAVSIPMKDALGWLVAIGGGHEQPGVGPSVTWLGRVALEGVRLAARGAIVPSVRVTGHAKTGLVESTVRWVPTLIDRVTLNTLAALMPGAVVAAGGGDGRATASAVIAAAVEAIVTESIERMELPAAPLSAAV